MDAAGRVFCIIKNLFKWEVFVGNFEKDSHLRGLYVHCIDNRYILRYYNEY